MTVGTTADGRADFRSSGARYRRPATFESTVGSVGLRTCRGHGIPPPRPPFPRVPFPAPVAFGPFACSPRSGVFFPLPLSFNPSFSRTLLVVRRAFRFSCFTWLSRRRGFRRARAWTRDPERRRPPSRVRRRERNALIGSRRDVSKTDAAGDPRGRVRRLTGSFSERFGRGGPRAHTHTPGAVRAGASRERDPGDGGRRRARRSRTSRRCVTMCEFRTDPRSPATAV